MKTLAKIAKAARSLSADCVNGTAPMFGTGRPWVYDDNEGAMARPFCALGHVYARAGLGPRDVPADLPEEERHVWMANDETPPDDRHAAVVFPLLAFADALEAA